VSTFAVTIYTKPDCVQCEYTKRELDKRGVKYLTIDVDTSISDADGGTVGDWLREQGWTQMPVVYNHANGEMWSGFKIDKLRDLGHSLGLVKKA
jgi:glutaredoxin-like protein NrdH